MDQPWTTCPGEPLASARSATVGRLAAELVEAGVEGVRVAPEVTVLEVPGKI